MPQRRSKKKAKSHVRKSRKRRRSRHYGWVSPYTKIKTFFKKKEITPFQILIEKPSEEEEQTFIFSRDPFERRNPRKLKPFKPSNQPVDQDVFYDRKLYEELLRKGFYSFGYSHNQGPKLFNVHYDDGILLADNAFGAQWGNPEVRAENAGSG